jgi:hypothetical protein
MRTVQRLAQALGSEPRHTQQLGGDIDANDAASRPHPVGQLQHRLPCATADIDNDLA